MSVGREAPEPPDSGTDGLQVGVPSEFVISQTMPVHNQLAHVIHGLASSNTRAFGGEVSAALIAGATNQIAAELTQTKMDLAQLRTKYESLSSTLSDERIEKAILGERIEAFRSIRHQKNIGISIGTILVGIGIQMIRSEATWPGIGAIFIGALLLIVGWITVPKEGGK